MNLIHTKYSSTASEPNIKIQSYFGAKIGGYGCRTYSNKSDNEVTYIENFKFENPEDVECLFKHDSNDKFIEVRVPQGSMDYRIVKVK